MERLFNEGSYCSDHVMQEYYAGVLLSSEGGFVDDEGVFYLSTMHRLSSIQLKAHYIIYQIIKEVYNGQGSISHLIGSEPGAGLTYIRASNLIEALYGENLVDETDLNIDEQYEQYQLCTDHVLQGLRKENLVKVFFLAMESETEPAGSNMFAHQSGFAQRPNKKVDPKIYCFFAPTLEGVQLFLWGQEYGKISLKKVFLSDEVICHRIDNIPLANFFDYVSQRQLFDDQLIRQLTGQKFDR